ncbi:MAG: substrate-binding domain-containing protein [Thermomicrobiales bacterium]
MTRDPERTPTATSRRASRRPWPSRIAAASAILLLVAAAVAVVGLWFIPGPVCCGPPETFKILAGTESRSLEPLIRDYGKGHHLNVEMTYMGSVDIMRELDNGQNSRYDAVWPANSLWIVLGDSRHVVTNSASIMRSPVVFGVKKSVAERLGWIGTAVSVDDILAATESGRLRFMMTSASQSDSGAAAYLGFLYAFAGHPDVLTSADLQDPAAQAKIKRILGATGGTAGDSDALKKQFLDRYDAFDAMVNDESAIIETNQALVQSGREPLFAIYPVDGTSIADWPFALIDKQDPRKEATFRGLKAHLLSSGVQNALTARGRRTGIGVNSDPRTTDARVFNPDWGIDTARLLTPIRLPEAAVIREALNLYQTSFRKPSLTVWALDFSGSMKSGDGQTQVKAAMPQLLDRGTASQLLLQASPEDVTVVIPFDDRVLDVWIVRGNDGSQLQQLDARISGMGADGGTDIYSAVIRGLDAIQTETTVGRFPAIVLMTDGKSEDGKTFADLQRRVAENAPGNVPIFAITFGDASDKQLVEITTLSSGELFDGRVDLMSAFRKAMGYA